MSRDIAKKNAYQREYTKRTRAKAQKEYYVRNRKTILAKMKIRDQKRREERRRWLDELKLGPCMDCGQRFHPAAMDFHHREERNGKRVSKQYDTRKWENVLAEIEKCDLLCANCHRIRHIGERWHLDYS